MDTLTKVLRDLGFAVETGQAGLETAFVAEWKSPAQGAGPVLGLFAEEEPTIEKLHLFVEEQGYNPHKKHHEIYLGDPRRTKPENLKTVIRQPVTKV